MIVLKESNAVLFLFVVMRIRYSEIVFLLLEILNTYLKYETQFD